MAAPSRMTFSFISALWRRCSLLACLLLAAPAWAAEVLLTAAEDSDGVQAFTRPWRGNAPKTM